MLQLPTGVRSTVGRVRTHTLKHHADQPRQRGPRMTGSGVHGRQCVTCEFVGGALGFKLARFKRLTHQVRHKGLQVPVGFIHMR